MCDLECLFCFDFRISPFFSIYLVQLLMNYNFFVLVYIRVSLCVSLMITNVFIDIYKYFRCKFNEISGISVIIIDLYITALFRFFFMLHSYNSK